MSFSCSESSCVLASSCASLECFHFVPAVCHLPTPTRNYSACTIFVTNLERNCCCSMENIGVIADCVVSFYTHYLFLPTLVFGSWEPPDATGNSVSDADCVPSSMSVCVPLQWFHNLMAFSSFVPVDTKLRLFNSSSSVSDDKTKYS